MSHTPVSSSTHDRDNTGILYEILTGQFSKSVPKMKAYSVIVFLALLLTAHGTVNDTTIAAGVGSDILNGLNRLVNKITNRNNVTANVTLTNDTRTNSTGLPLEIVCPPPTPHEVFQYSDTAVTKLEVQLYSDTKMQGRIQYSRKTATFVQAK
jgi:hypothetical protein